MRHIKKYNEDILNWDDKKPFNIEDYIDIEYIEGCFSNLIDNADVDYETGEDGNKMTHELIFYPDDVVKYRNGNMDRVDETIRHITEIKDLLDEIKSAISKVQIEYPGLVPNLDIEHSRNKNAEWNELIPILCISVKYTGDSVDKYLKSKK